MDTPDLICGEDGALRCFWGARSALYRTYHDEEWGHPTSDDIRLYEKVCLEGFQSGLSWLTVLRKRDAFRAAFRGFDFRVVANFNQRSVERLVRDASIIRHRKKIESTINNARRAIELVDEFGSLARYFWSFEPEVSRAREIAAQPLRERTSAPEAVDLSKDLKSRGWTFVGPKTAYALMQAMGLVNDHHPECHAYQRVARLRRRFVRPQ